MSEEIIKAWCVKCRTKQPIKDPQEVEVKGKGGTPRKMLRGFCPICGTKMTKFVKSSKKVEPDIAKEISDFDKESQLK